MPPFGRLLTTAGGILWAISFSVASAGSLPEGFVYLSDADPTIVQDMRYASAANFTRAPVPGYRAAECVLTTEAAKALARVQQNLRAKKFGLKVWDCYRPAKAVKAFVAWVGASRGFDKDYHPRVARSELISEGYIGKRSGHSAGSTVDLTLIDSDGRELDMGTGFDFFDPLARTASGGISRSAKANRELLLRAMKQQGFRNYAGEWWHFSLERQPFAGRVFDFDIVPRGG
jgi:D-alanyl-D-alanine dipeptidase